MFIGAVGVAACNDESKTVPTAATNGPPVAACGAAHSTRPIAAARFIENRNAIRFVYASSPDGGEPCGFAAAPHEGILYVELRTPNRAKGRNRQLACVDGRLDRRSPARRLSLIGRADNHALRSEIADFNLQAFFDTSVECADVSRMQPSFVID
jgi:hypothetical protein